MDISPLFTPKDGVERRHDERWAEKRQVVVWDLPTRIFHMLLVTFVVVGWATAEGAEDGGVVYVLHKISGYGLAASLLFRLVWGIGGSHHSRFSDFVRPWREVRDYIRDLLTFAPHRIVGHNPLGGWMAVIMLAVIAMVVATGLYSVGDDVAGPLADRIPHSMALIATELHEAVFYILAVLAGLHVLGVLGASFLHRENLIRSMWNGRKLLPKILAQDEEELVATGWGLVVALVAVAVVGFSLM